jgi:proteasome lid subunit RPN8/RPN11
MHQITGNLRLELLRLATKRAPEEAVGLILRDRRVIELLNTSTDPQHGFEVHRGQVIGVLENESDLLDITFWHSHPGGGVGPSRVDMQNKTPFPYHLVIALTGGDIACAWY